MKTIAIPVVIPQRGVGSCSNAERSGIARAFLEVLDVKAEWRCDEHACDIDSADYTMELPKTRPKAVGELHWAKQQSARTGDAMRQQPPGLYLRGREII